MYVLELVDEMACPMMRHVPDNEDPKAPEAPADASLKLLPGTVSPHDVELPVTLVTKAYVPTAPAPSATILPPTQLLSLPPVANFWAVTFELAILLVVTALLAIFAVVTALLAIFAVVTALLAIFAVVTALLAIPLVCTLGA